MDSNASNSIINICNKVFATCVDPLIWKKLFISNDHFQASSDESEIYDGFLYPNSISADSIHSLATLAYLTIENYGCGKCQTKSIVFKKFKNILNESCENRFIVFMECAAHIEMLLLKLAFGKQPKNGTLLKDILVSSNLTNKLPDKLVLVLQIIFLPSGFNLRNLIWHGFMAPHELDPRYLALILMIYYDLFIINESNIPYKITKTLPSKSNFNFIVSSMYPNQFNTARSLINNDLIHYLLKLSIFILPARENLFLSSYDDYLAGDYKRCILKLLPILEQGLRLLFCVSNGLTAHLFAQEDAYYTTLDGFGQRSKHQLLLDPWLSANATTGEVDPNNDTITEEDKIDECAPKRSQRSINQLPRTLTYGQYSLLVDLFMTAAGPNVRARFAHSHDCPNSFYPETEDASLHVIPEDTSQETSSNIERGDVQAWHQMADILLLCTIAIGWKQNTKSMPKLLELFRRNSPNTTLEPTLGAVESHPTPNKDLVQNFCETDPDSLLISTLMEERLEAITSVIDNYHSCYHPHAILNNKMNNILLYLNKLLIYLNQKRIYITKDKNTVSFKVNRYVDDGMDNVNNNIIIENNNDYNDNDIQGDKNTLIIEDSKDKLLTLLPNYMWRNEWMQPSLVTTTEYPDSISADIRDHSSSYDSNDSGVSILTSLPSYISTDIHRTKPSLGTPSLGTLSILARERLSSIFRTMIRILKEFNPCVNCLSAATDTEISSHREIDLRRYSEVFCCSEYLCLVSVEFFFDLSNTHSDGPTHMPNIVHYALEKRLNILESPPCGISACLQLCSVRTLCTICNADMTLFFADVCGTDC